ncbi:hypothetical protein ACNFBT_11695 [Pseudomonas sp. NY15181]|uniref:hypothetical protein n=1 Tax=Pseudomonas sp. NY15181 TaxID=3400349 RepID=UPI003A846839
MRKLSTTLLALISGLISTQVLAETVSPQAELYYQRALSDMERAQQLLTGSNQISSMEVDATRKSLNNNLEKATELGHPAAALYQAQLTLGMASDDGETRQQACTLLGSWAKKGFVAAAVVNFSQCNRAYLRFDFASPEHQSALQTLTQSLTKNDPAQPYYPFSLATSLCFPADALKAVVLSQEQFRAEAEYMLGSSQEPTDAESTRHILTLLDSAADRGCQIPTGLRSALRQQLRSQ